MKFVLFCFLNNHYIYLDFLFYDAVITGDALLNAVYSWQQLSLIAYSDYISKILSAFSARLGFTIIRSNPYGHLFLVI